MPSRLRHRLVYGLLLVLVVGLAQSVSADDSPAPKTESTLHTQHLTVGAPTDSFPYGFAAPDGKLTGFATEVLDAVARIMRLDIHRVTAPSMEVQRRFSEGEFDMMQSLTFSPARDAYADFSVPLLTLRGMLYVRKGGQVSNISDLNGRKFAVIGRGSIGERFLHDQGLNVEVIYVSSTVEALRGLQQGRYDATFASQLTALATVYRERLKDVVVLGQPYADYDIRHCFAVHKGSAQLLARLNEGLAILNRTGEFQQIYDRWFGHLESNSISRRLVLNYALVVLSVATILARLAVLHRRTLKRRIAEQTARLTEQTVQLTAQRAVLQTLYDNIPMAICLLEQDPNGFRVVSINRQAEPWVGCSSTNINSQYLHQFPNATEWMHELAAILSNRPVIQGLVREERRLQASAKRIIYTLVPMQVDSAGGSRLCVIGEDITERRALDEEISQSRRLRAIGELVGGIAHEFNNLLTPVVLKTSEIQYERPDDKPLHEDIKLIADAAQRAGELTRRLLTFGRKVDNTVQSVQLDSMVSACLALLKLTVDRRIVWEYDIPENLPPLSFNPTDLNQIILNLVLNARDTLVEKLAAPHPEGWVPTIRLEARHLPPTSVERLEPRIPSRRTILGWQRFTIRDNGMGMDPEVRERIFEPFYTTKDVGKGTGLGLATVWHLVTEVSGRIEVESLRGEGSAFHVYLPVYAAKQTPPTAPKKAEPAPKRHGRIFLAEDDEMIATTLHVALQRAGHQLVREPDGSASWKHLQNNLDRYDLLILDVNMPGLDGIELARRVRDTGRYQGSIMIISGRLSSDDLSEINTAKIDRVLSKPFELGEFLSAINTCLNAK
ncbi:MAG: transporter substrate-binding domain-containing protein [Nibricoccus sp.]